MSEGLYTLRASTVAAGNLPEAMLREHGISVDPFKAVLNVMVQQEGGAAPATWLPS